MADARRRRARLHPERLQINVEWWDQIGAALPGYVVKTDYVSRKHPSRTRPLPELHSYCIGQRTRPIDPAGSLVRGGHDHLFVGGDTVDDSTRYALAEGDRAAFLEPDHVHLNWPSLLPPLVGVRESASYWQFSDDGMAIDADLAEHLIPLRNCTRAYMTIGTGWVKETRVPFIDRYYRQTVTRLTSTDRD